MKTKNHLQIIIIIRKQNGTKINNTKSLHSDLKNLQLLYDSFIMIHSESDGRQKTQNKHNYRIKN